MLMLKRTGFMASRTNGKGLKSKSFSRGGTLRRGTTRITPKGPRAVKWENFRNATFEAEKDEEGLIRCQDTQIGLPSCGVSSSEMDLHHILGRDGDLLTDRTKMVWLTRDCHKAIHAGHLPI